MARRVIATAEVQVAANVGQAEAGLNGLTESFRSIGTIAERAAERAEIAFLSSSRTIKDGLEEAQRRVMTLAVELDQGGDAAQEMGNHILEVAARIEKADREGRELTETISDWANLLRQSAGMANAVQNGLEDVNIRAEAAARSTQEIEGAIRASEIRAEMLAQAFRDVGRDIDIAMAGGLGQIEDDILVTIQRLSGLGGEFLEVARIGEAALDGIYTEFDADSNEAINAVMRLERQLRSVSDAEIANRAMQEMQGEIRAAEIRVEMLGKAFRDVGQDIEVAMSGGVEGIQDDIRDTIRRLNDMGGEFEEVGRIGESALDNVLGEFDADVNTATAALIRLERQLHEVAEISDRALEGLDDDARQAAGAMDTMSDSARRADRSIDGIGKVASRTSSDVRGLVGLIGAAGLGFAASSAARSGIEMTLQLEKSRAMFLGLTGSVEGASDMLERMVKFARETPYNLANVSDAAAQLLAVGDGFGVTTSTIEDFLTTFGNAITMTGGGDEQFTRLVRVFGQMSSSGKVLGQDMNQLAQSLPGFNVWEALAEGAHTSVAELRRLQDLGTLDNLLTGDQAVRILVEGMEKIPGAAGAMERRMHTLGGAIEKFKETAQFAMSEGLIPFSEVAQDTLNDPVILNGVNDLSEAFGELLSSGLKAVRPELDDLAAGAESVINAFEDWAPLLTATTDSVSDFLSFIGPLISGLGKAASSVLNFGDGLGKMAVAAGLFAVGGPFGIAGGLILGVSGALDKFAGDTQRAAETARILAAAQGEVNTAMNEGKEVIYTEAQQQAINQAQDIIDNYGSLATAMQVANSQTGLGVINVGQLNQAFADLASGTEITDANVLAFLADIDRFRTEGIADNIVKEFDAYQAAWESGTTTVQTETEKQTDALLLAGTEDLAAMDERAARQKAYNDEVKAYWEEYGQNYQAAIDAQNVANDGWGELDEERTDTVKKLLEDQVKAYDDWEADINGSTDGAALSLSSVAEEAENSASRMIQAINENSVATAAWKGNIVTAATQVQGALGLTDTEAQDFMGTLGEMGPAAAPALQQMVDDFKAGGSDLQNFYSATAVNAAVMATDLTDSFDDATGSVPSLAESLSEGTATIDEVLAALPAAMSAAGIDMETAANMIDLSGEMGGVGTEAVNGLVAALDAGVGRARAAGTRLSVAAHQGANAGLDIHSPSKVMFETGEFAVEGLVMGMDSMSDEAYDKAVQVASLMGGGIAWYFSKAEEPYDEAKKFAEEVAQTIVDELIAEQEAVADAAEALAEAAADRLSEAWDRVKDRFKTRDIAEAITDAQADLQDARAELASAEAFASTGGQEALAAAQQRIARAQQQIAQAQQAQHAAEAADAAAELLADKTLKDFQRSTEDAVAALKEQQAGEVDAANQRIADAKRRLDPVARAAAEADLAAIEARHEAEMTAFDRQREDEAAVLKLRLDNEDAIRDAAIKAQEDQVNAFEKALDDANKEFEDVGDKIADAIKDLPGLRTEVGDSQRNLEGAFFDQFEKLLESVSSVDRGLLESVGANAGLSATEVNDLINSAIASESASQGAAAANLGVGQLLEVLQSGLFSLGANGALGIAEGLSSQAHAIAEALFASVESAVASTLQRLDIHSPSGVTEDLIGKPMADGIAVGIMKAQGAVQSAMTGLVDSVVGGVRIPSTSQLVGASSGGGDAMTGAYRGPLVTMPGAVIQDATDADLVAQRVVVALAATGIQV